MRSVEVAPAIHFIDNVHAFGVARTADDLVHKARVQFTFVPILLHKIGR